MTTESETKDEVRHKKKADTNLRDKSYGEILLHHPTEIFTKIAKEVRGGSESNIP